MSDTERRDMASNLILKLAASLGFDEEETSDDEFSTTEQVDFDEDLEDFLNS